MGPLGLLRSVLLTIMINDGLGSFDIEDETQVEEVATTPAPEAPNNSPSGQTNSKQSVTRPDIQTPKMISLGARVDIRYHFFTRCEYLNDGSFASMGELWFFGVN